MNTSERQPKFNKNEASVNMKEKMQSQTDMDAALRGPAGAILDETLLEMGLPSWGSNPGI